MPGYDIYGVGNALVDIQVQVDFALLEKQRIDKGVMTLVSAAKQTELLRLLKGRPMQVSSGGSACNTMVGVANFGGSAYYAGKVGNDRYGEFFQNELKELGIRSDLAPVNDPTGTCLVLITPDADRTMLTCLAASVALDEEDIREAQVRKAGCVYVEGYLWDSPGPRHACQEAMATARVHKIPVAFSYSDPFCVKRAAADFRELSRSSVDLVFCNEEEARMISGETDGVKACLAIASWGPRVYMTAGADGAYYADGEKVEHIAAFPVEAVDTNGAGDLFAGGALFGLARGYSPLEAGRLGSYAASLVVTQVGPRLPHPLAGQVDDILAGTVAGA
jgi:sugar/nucleoside kinase (ribokinase family)